MTRTMRLDQFVQFLGKTVAGMPAAQERGLKAGAAIIAEEARAEIGHYQTRTGPFAQWQKLAETTLEGWRGFPGKIELGYAPPDNPLLRTGELRDSIGYQLPSRRRALIGSPSWVAFWQEFGTAPAPGHPGIPARSFIGRAAARKGREAAHAIGEKMFGPLSRGRLR